jgi:CDP-diglyceride synthetase
MTFAVRHDIEGPKVRLGVVWFGLTVGACALSPLALAAVMAAAAALAADQVVRRHAPEGATGPVLEDPARLSAVLGAASLPLAASQGIDTLAAALTATVVLTMVATTGRAALPVLGSLSIGLAAASPVLLQRLGMAAALFLLVLVAAYDAGDFLVGTGAGTAWEGPAAGVAAAAVVGFAAVVLAPPPLQEEGAAALAVLVALLAPLGPPLASLLVGDAVTPARFVRRLDSLLLAGPIAAYVLAALLPRL